jgi:hypothetical protein
MCSTLPAVTGFKECVPSHMCTYERGQQPRIAWAVLRIVVDTTNLYQQLQLLLALSVLPGVLHVALATAG